MGKTAAVNCAHFGLPKSEHVFEQQIEFIRSIAERENTLTANRFGWFLTAQSALLAALGLLLGLNPDDIGANIPSKIPIVIGAVSLLGFGMSVTTIYAVATANKALGVITSCWDCLTKSDARNTGYCVNLLPVRPTRFSLRHPFRLSSWSWLHPHMLIPWMTAAMWIGIAWTFLS